MIGQTISHYKILEKLGEGGMGVVYTAKDTKLKRTVALKFLPPDLTRDEDAKERFIHEAQAASALDHSNICTIYEIAETDDGQSFIAMAHYDGETLKEKIARGPLQDEGAVNITIQVAQGLSRAHESDIVHRDTKPANIIVTDRGEVKILDFGLAKLAGQTKVTKTGTTVGTAAYMSPEQARGEAVDHRTDIWSVGVMLYEMLTGQLPFKGDYEQAILYSIINEEPKALRKINPAVSPELEHIVNRALKKKPESRYSSAAELLKDLKRYQESLRIEELGVFNLRTFLLRIRRPRIAVPAVFVLLVIILLGIWFFNRQAKIRWAKEQALPEVEKLIENSWRDFTDAYKLAEKAEKYIPDDPKLAELLSRCSFKINVKTEPPGANVYLNHYSTPESEWKPLGISPLERIRVPNGIFRWKIEMEGFQTVLAVSSTWNIKIAGKTAIIPNDFVRVLDKEGSILPGMVRVRGEGTDLGELEDFFIDKYEVTNKQFKEFVDGGGYRKREFWEHEFMKEGKVLAWSDAMAEFVDQTGRSGPSTWQAGDYPEGQADYPVSGISWYEAVAYSEFVGKTLPTVHHWGIARGEYTTLIRVPALGGYAVIAPFSNFKGKGPVAVGSLPGITSYGAFDMAGNVREWCWNETEKGRVLRGGAWNDTPYMFGGWSQAPPFDRSPKNGFRCALYPDPQNIPAQAFGKGTFRERRDFSEEKPVSDSIYRVYREQFSYDKTPLDARVESRDDSSEDWTKEKITFDTAYGDERMMAYFFLPKNATPPYQTIIYFPGSNALFYESSEDMEEFIEWPIFVSFLVKNGRAVLFPVYKGTFERRDDALAHADENSHLYTEYRIQLVKDFKRSIDYLETRQDIDTSKLAYYGMSWGAILGAIIPAVEERLKANIILAGGLTGRGRPEANAINYVTRVKIPTLMLSGKYDSLLPYETSVKPLFDLLGTPDEHKELKLYETDHIPPRNEFIKEILVWLDRYLGPVD